MIKDKGKYIEHIKDEKQILVMRKVLDKVEKVIDNHEVQHTDFLDPYQRRLCYSFLNRFTEISYFEEGGYQEAERKSVVLYPFYVEYENIDSPIGAVRIEGRFEYNLIAHRDVLGSVLGLGIKREKIGDICIQENFIDVILDKEILDYVVYNLKVIGKENVQAKAIYIRDTYKGIVQFSDKSTTISSLRLDNLVSAAINVSRSISLGYVNSNKIKVNWQPITQPSYEIQQGDIVSVRGFGRFKLLNVLGESKKGRSKIVIRKYT